MTLATIANRQPATMVISTGKPSLAMADAAKARPSATNANPLDMVSRFIVLRRQRVVRGYRGNNNICLLQCRTTLILGIRFPAFQLANGGYSFHSRSLFFSLSSLSFASV